MMLLPRYQPGEVQTRIAAILSASGFLDSTAEDSSEGGELGLVLERTPFYAEQGGQVADQGTIASTSASFAVHDTRVRPPSPLHAMSLTRCI